MKANCNKKNLKGIGYLFVLYEDLNGLHGQNTAIINLYKQLLVEGYFRPIILVNSWKDISPRYIELNDMVVIYLRLLRSLSFTPRGILGSIFYLASTLLRLIRIINSYNIKIVNIHAPVKASIIFVILKFISRIKIIAWYHGIITFNSEVASGRFGSKIITKFMKSSDAIITCSSFVQKHLIGYMPSIAEKTFVIYNGFSKDLDFSYKRHDFHHLPEGLRNNKFILCIGAFNDIKCQNVLIEAFALINAKIQNTKLVLIGGHGNQLPNVKKLIDQLGLNDSVLVFNNVPRDKIHVFLHHASLFVLPSKNEALGIAILEAGSFNLPVIATRVGGIPEIIEDGKNGLLTKSQDVQELAYAILNIFSNPEKAQEMARELKKKISDKFTWEIAHKQLIQITNNLLSEGAARK
jgi:glycosyltransferase involved in cell wall biosynthesis